MYLALKHLHVTTVIISISLFVLRGIWMATGSAQLSRDWVKIAPHVNDTILLGSAIGLTITLGQYPFINGWLTAKVCALAVYVGLGTIALKRGKTKRIRIAAWIAAMLTFAYIVAVAVSRDVLP